MFYQWWQRSWNMLSRKRSIINYGNKGGNLIKTKFYILSLPLYTHKWHIILHLWLGWEVTVLQDVEVSFFVEASPRDIVLSKDEDDVPCTGNFFRRGEVFKHDELLDTVINNPLKPNI